MKELYETYEPYIFKYLYGLTLDFYKAEELTQETFFQVIRSFHRFRGDCHVATWIYKIARNVFIQYLRKNADPTISLSEDILDIAGNHNPEAVLERKESNEFIITALLKLPVKQREVLWLRDWQGLSYEEIAGITTRSVSWVKVNIHRGRVAFKKVYCEGGDYCE
ncbi:MAG: RNA polymerase sigma factor [Solirubrobacterales bacterium]